MQAYVPGIPLGVGGAKLELADIPAVLGASLSGSVGGMICGFLYGVFSPAYLALIPSMVIVLTLLGCLSDNLKRGRIALAIILSRAIIGPVLSAILFKWIYFSSIPFLSVWLLCFSYAIPGVIIVILLRFLIEKKFYWLISSLET